MKKSILLVLLAYFAFTGCTVVVDPHPHYIVNEVGYRGDRPAEVYYYGGYYYYAPCSYIDSRYHHRRVTYYNSYSMRVVSCQRPETVIIKEAPHHHDTVIIKEAPRQNTVVIKEQAPAHSHNTVIIKEEPKQSNTVIIKEKAPERNQVIIQESKTPSRSSSSRSGNKVIIKK